MELKTVQIAWMLSILSWVVSSVHKKLLSNEQEKRNFKLHRKHSKILQCGLSLLLLQHKTNEKNWIFSNQTRRNSIWNFYILLQQQSFFIEFIFEVNLRSGISRLYAQFKIHKNQKRTKPISTTACKYVWGVGEGGRKSFLKHKQTPSLHWITFSKLPVFIAKISSLSPKILLIKLSHSFSSVLTLNFILFGLNCHLKSYEMFRSRFLFWKSQLWWTDLATETRHSRLFWDT